MGVSNLRAFTAGAIAFASTLTLGSGLAHASYLYTFNNAASFTTQEATFGYNPTVPNFRFDYGQSTAAANHAAAFTTVAGNGAVQVTEKFSYATDGVGGNAYTIDLFPSPSPTDITNISFDIRLDPASAKDLFGGAGFLNVITRSDGYASTQTPYSEEFGNPSYGAPTAGTYEHISIPVSGASSNVRALTLQLYNSGDRQINGNVIFDIDNLQLTSVSGGAIPEPASLGLLAVVVPAIVRRRRAV